MDNKPKVETLIVNLYAGPGTGKSTTAAGLFYRLKKANINSEYIQEYAKDKAWQGDMFTLECQPYITAKQLYRLHRVMGKCEVVITDSPLIQGLVYGGSFVDDNFKRWVVSTSNSMRTLDIFLQRDLQTHAYNPAGRSQSLEEAIKLDEEIYKLVDANLDHGKTIHKVSVGDDSYLDHIESLIRGKLKL